LLSLRPRGLRPIAIKPWLFAGVLCVAFSLCPAGAKACSLEQVSQMPLITLGDHVAVLAKINNATRPMMVDTGAEVTTLTSQAVTDLKLKSDPDASKVRPTLGIGQTSASSLHLNALPETLGFGDLVFHDRSTVVTDMAFGPIPEQKAVGLLGDDILSQYDVEFDFAGKTLSLYKAVGCYETFIPWLGPYAQIPFDHHENKMVADLILDGERTRAIIDTGNNTSFVTRRASALFGIPPDAFMDTKGKSTSPLNGGTSQTVQLYVFGKVRLGDEIFRKKPMGVIDVDLITGAANIGLDYFKGHKLWICYRSGVMFVSRDPAASKLGYTVIKPQQQAAVAIAAKPVEPEDAAP